MACAIRAALTSRIGKSSPTSSGIWLVGDYAGTSRSAVFLSTTKQPNTQEHPREESTTMSASTTRKLTGIKYAATILGAFAFLAVAPATAFAVDNDPTPSGGCHSTDADGYDVPIDE